MRFDQLIPVGLYDNMSSARHYKPDGLRFVCSAPSYYPRKGEAMPKEVQTLFEEIETEIKKNPGLEGCI